MKKSAVGKYALRYLLTILVIGLLSAVSVMAEETHSTTYKGTDYKLVYDYEYYTTNVHPELAGKSDTAVLKYFVKTGMENGEQAIASFSVKSYRNANQDLRKKYGKTYTKYFKHYMKYGYKQSKRKDTLTGYDNVIKDPVTSYNGKSYDKVYDFNYYMKKYPRLAKKYALDDFGAIKYFVKKGMAKKHQANDAFNVVWYYNTYRPLRYKYETNYAKYYKYYQKKGYKRGKVKKLESLNIPITYYKKNGKKIDLSKIYDFEYYTKHNSAAYKYWKNQDDAGAVKHFVKYGIKQGLKANKKYNKNTNAYKKLLNKLYPNVNDNEYAMADKHSSYTSYLILVNQGKHMVYVFKGKTGAWTKIKEFPCDVGAPATPTPVGRFCLGSKGLYFDSGSARCWYWSAIYGGILFHSVLYHQTSAPTSILDGTMGASVSHGCVRLHLANAKWIQDNCPSGTVVVTYNRPF